MTVAWSGLFFCRETDLVSTNLFLSQDVQRFAKIARELRDVEQVGVLGSDRQTPDLHVCESCVVEEIS